MAMCELLGMSSNHPASLNLSLTKLAEHGGPPTSIRDGWGVAYYEGTDIRLIKDAEPASDSDWLRFIGQHDLESSIVMAHIRKATIGERAYRNAQPFARELAGRMHIFAHNGWLPGIADAPERQSTRFAPVGETDSEQAFCALLDDMRKIWRQPRIIPPLADRLSMVSAFAADLRSLGPANFLYSDGDALFAHGDRRKQSPTGSVKAPGLVFLQRKCQPTGTGFAASGISVGAQVADQSITLIASVPLTDDAWQPVAEGAVIAISKGQILLQSMQHNSP
jgi:predicted glutamine amidotransferase